MSFFNKKSTARYLSPEERMNELFNMTHGLLDSIKHDKHSGISVWYHLKAPIEGYREEIYKFLCDFIHPVNYRNRLVIEMDSDWNYKLLSGSEPNDKICEVFRKDVESKLKFLKAREKEIDRMRLYQSKTYESNERRKKDFWMQVLISIITYILIETLKFSPTVLNYFKAKLTG